VRSRHTPTPLAGRARPKQRLAQVVLGGDDFMGQLFVFGKRFDHLEDDRNV
jgi:hypothetical protein